MIETENNGKIRLDSALGVIEHVSRTTHLRSPAANKPIYFCLASNSHKHLAMETFLFSWN